VEWARLIGRRLLSKDEALEICIQIAEGFEVAYQKGISYHDLVTDICYLKRASQRRRGMGTEENIAWLRRVYERLDAGDLGVIEEAWDPDFLGHWPGQELRGWKGYRDMISASRAGLPDVRHNFEIMIAADDMFAAHATLTGTHRGGLFGKPATGKKVAFTSTGIWRIRSGKIVEIWCDADFAGLMAQLQ
jgi:predicted ester cyclase